VMAASMRRRANDDAIVPSAISPEVLGGDRAADP
jgi:hypothetical protein